MKVCKKCKKQVANKTKICKYCGADVSNSKIIKSVNNSNKNTVNKKINSKANIKKPTVPINVLDNTYVHHIFNFTEEKEISKKSSNKLDILKNKIKKEKPQKIKKEKEPKIKEVKKPKKIKVKQTLKLDTKEKLKDLEQTAVIKIKEVVKTTNKEVKKISSKTKKGVSNVSNAIKPKKQRTKTLIVTTIALLFLTIGILFGLSVYKSLSDKEAPSISAEKATKDKIFKMQDTIDYNGVLYKILKIETSAGNNYKKPKDGYQFLIVTLSIKNNTDKKVPYSYANWTMTNSKKEEKKRIFTSINVDNALYSGDLVIGGLKTGSIVFEQPKNDSKLVLNYYELKKDDYGNDIADQGKRIFSINIDVPKEKVKAVANTDVGSSKNKIKKD